MSDYSGLPSSVDSFCVETFVFSCWQGCYSRGLPGSPAGGLGAPSLSAAGIAQQLQTAPHQSNKLAPALQNGSDASVGNTGTELPANELYARYVMKKAVGFVFKKIYILFGPYQKEICILVPNLWVLASSWAVGAAEIFSNRLKVFILKKEF